ncbi:hypothetical protein B0H16DRAFT_1476073 [Mycena metata]|uniref:Uncharacterized protein n=1 Tax=Mycena metata TaxID=1033252 RepID=A0AAD7HCA8_9AGAR|nr:hypothetical protein B0H16DRAFT_1476073 [Mycena metata]
MSVDDKKQRLNFSPGYLRNICQAMDQNEQNVKDIDALIGVFNGISKDVTSFNATFEWTMARVGNKSTSDIQRAKEDIASLPQKFVVQSGLGHRRRVKSWSRINAFQLRSKQTYKIE